MAQMAGMFSINISLFSIKYDMFCKFVTCHDSAPYPTECVVKTSVSSKIAEDALRITMLE